MKEEKSLADRMNEAFRLSLQLAYETIDDKGHYFDYRQSGLGNLEDTIYGWADGLSHKYYETHASGRCSFQSMIDFDVGKFEVSVLKDIRKMKNLLKRIGPPKKLTKEQLRSRGYKRD